MKHLKAPMMVSEYEARVISASSGYAWTKDVEAEISDLLGCADQTLYDAKNGKEEGIYWIKKAQIDVLIHCIMRYDLLS